MSTQAWRAHQLEQFKPCCTLPVAVVVIVEKAGTTGPQAHSSHRVQAHHSRVRGLHTWCDSSELLARLHTRTSQRSRSTWSQMQAKSHATKAKQAILDHKLVAWRIHHREREELTRVNQENPIDPFVRVGEATCHSKRYDSRDHRHIHNRRHHTVARRQAVVSRST